MSNSAGWNNNKEEEIKEKQTIVVFVCHVINLTFKAMKAETKTKRKDLTIRA